MTSEAALAHSGIVLKSPAEIATMREAGRIAAVALQQVAAAVQPGMTTDDLNEVADRVIRAGGGVPAFLGMYGFPKSICTSVNDEVVHGIPSSKVVLQSGDIVTVDLGVVYDGFYSDHAVTVPLGTISDGIRKLINATQDALAAGISAAVAGNVIDDIAGAIERSLRKSGSYGIIREYCGHGVGRDLHEDPQVPNAVDKRRPDRTRLEVGTVIAIEPMVTNGSWKTRKRRGDDWTVYTADGSIAAHFEHTVAITADGPLVLTAP